jgi:hypothetical protein
MTQKERVLGYLKTGQKLNRLISWDRLGILECPARISELRSEGYNIRTARKSVYNRYGEKVSIAEWSM